MSSKIDLTKAYEKPDKKWRAYVWSPDDPEEKAPCTISVINGKPIKVECWENINAFDQLFCDLNFHNPLEGLHGVFDDGKHFSLFYLRLETFRLGTGIPHIGLLAKFLVSGVHLQKKEKKIEALYIRQQLIDEWSNLTPIEFKQESDQTFGKFNVEIDLPEKTTLFHSNELEVFLGHEISYSSQKVNRMILYPIPRIALKFNSPILLDKAITFRNAIKHLMKCFIGIECGIVESTIKTGDYQIQEIFTYENKLRWDFNSLSHRNIFLNMEVVLPFSNSILSSWFRIFGENQTAINEYYRISGERTLVNQREIFMNSIQGVEMFYKILEIKVKIDPKSKNGKKKGELWKKLESMLVILHGLIFEFIPDNEIFLKKVIETRNHFSHYNLKSRDNDPLIIPQNYLGIYSKRIELICNLCLLIKLGLPIKIVSERFKKHYYFLILKGENMHLNG
ncbi:ApeA N-terminal domain 1-containing protein [Pleomorphovibrio marinus]|uniref:ApeA N-terminal domain 1-containing protein n=1 Tax=Pleomorphovibrio marinus TaxID=2164132 RepID=UPI000E0C9433|nr:HEPN domain-containing protein [Pleomorphovibrio marinus]